MDWVERLNEAIRYIEDNLTGNIEYDRLGRIACCSAYHFQRMFTYIAGMPLSEYIRRRKMSLAAVDLQGGGEDWRYYIAVASSAAIDSSLEEYLVPGGMWAIFPGSGTGRSIQELERRIVTEWLPTSGYEFTEGPDIEVYFEPDPQNTSYEVWIPVRKSRACRRMEEFCGRFSLAGKEEIRSCLLYTSPSPRDRG